SSPQPLAGIDVELVHAGGSDTIDLGAIAASLAPGQHILLAEDGSVLDPVADALLFSATIDPEFGVRILDTGSGLVLDEVGNAEDLGAGWAAAAFREGVGLPNPIGTGGFELSFERKSGFGAGNCVDTEDNAADFLRNFATGAVNPESFADPVVVCGTHVVPGPADHIVLSEFRTNGPNGGGDEFIEVFNPHSSPIDVSSTKVFANGSEEYAFPAVSLQPGEHWLIAGGNFLGPRDGVYGGIANGTSSIELWDGATLVDQILIDSGPGSVPKTSDTDSGTVQRANNGCADYAQPDFNYLWGGAPTPRTSGPTYAPC
ncbi:MAG: lamin tail domain-containing protein, partial [Acidimicrobiales bacterium]